MTPEPHAVRTLFAEAKGRQATHFPYPCLGRTRLILPVETREASVGKSFFFSKWKRVKMDAAHLAGLLSGHFPKNGVREAAWIAVIKALSGKEAAKIAVSTGTPGPYTKLTALLLDEKCRPVVVCKIGNTRASISLLKTEWAWLQALSEKSDLAGRVPRPVETQQVNDVFVIIQSVGEGREAGRSLCPGKIAFLASFQKNFPGGECFLGSNMHEAMQGRLNMMRGKMSPHWQDRAEVALVRLERFFRGRVVRMGAAHRDFCPWNIRISPGGTFVFDWEYASADYLPLYDIFHFLMMPRVLKRGLSAGALRRVMKQAVEAARGWPAEKIAVPDYQLLAYLLDVGLFYLEANQGDDREDRVLRRYGRLIDQFDAWSL